MADDSAGSPVLVSRDGAVTTITLSRPGLSAAAKTALRDAIDEAAHDAAARALVLTGTGRSFCVGQDLAEHAAALRSDPAKAFDTISEHYTPIVRGLTEMPKPVIAAINGTCVGAGLGFALACDLRVAASGARFGTAFTQIGLTCDSGLSATLTRAVGAARASELILLAELFTAEQAAEWGLITRVVPAGELPATAAELAARLAAGPTLAYAAAKRAIAEATSPPLPETLRTEAAAQLMLGGTEDHRNAVESFLAKKPATFSAH